MSFFQTACPPGFIPLCKDGVAAGRTDVLGGCPVASVMGCVDGGTSLDVACNKASRIGYPTPGGYPIFVVSLSPPAYFNLVAACYSQKVQQCGSPPSNTKLKQDSLYAIGAWNETHLVGEELFHASSGSSSSGF